MKTTLMMLAVAAVIGAPAIAFAEDSLQQDQNKVEYNDNGGYTSTGSSEQVNPDGSKMTSDNKTTLSVDSDGSSKKTSVKNTKVSNGVMHTKTERNKTVYTKKANGGYTQTTTSKHTNTDGTNVTFVTTTDVDIDSDGNVTTVAKTEKTVDPKGMFNKTTTTSRTKTVNGNVVEQNKDTQ